MSQPININKVRKAVVTNGTRMNTCSAVTLCMIKSQNTDNWCNNCYNNYWYNDSSQDASPTQDASPSQ